jgi:hypothetical protein
LPDLPVVRDLQIPVGDYLASSDELGSPAFSLAELTSAGASPRAGADAQLIRLLDTHTELVPALPPAPGAPAPVAEAVAGGSAALVGNCVAFTPAPGTTGTITLRLPAGGVVLAAGPGPAVNIALRRFGDGFGNTMRPLGGGATARIAIPADAAPVPWRAQVTTAQRIQACPNPSR